MTSPRDLEGKVLSTKSVYEDGTLSVKLMGCLDMETTPRLRDYLAVVLLDIEAGSVQRVVFDADQLYLMSSSAISCFASFLKCVKVPERTWAITFRTNPAHTWQHRAFEPLRRLDENLVNLE